MSTKVGVSPGFWDWTEGNTFMHFVDECESLGWDSIWLIDRLISERRILDPIVGMATIAARTSRLKFGTSVLIPSLRNPAVLAKELATIDFLAGGRLLPAVGLGSDDLREYEAAGIEKRSRANRTEEAIEILRLLWAGDNVTYHGRYYHMNDVSVNPKPLFTPSLPIWIGGRSQQAQRRVAKIGDGWLASGLTPEEAGVGVQTIKRHLDLEGRHIEDDHYGVILGTYLSDSPEAGVKSLQSRTSPVRNDKPLETYSLVGTASDISNRIQLYQEAGISKFVLRLMCPEAESLNQLSSLAETVASPINSRP